MSTAQIVLCKNCGSENYENDNFCQKCGKLITEFMSDHFDSDYKKAFCLKRRTIDSKIFSVFDINFNEETYQIDSEAIYIRPIYIKISLILLFLFAGVMIVFDLSLSLNPIILMILQVINILYLVPLFIILGFITPICFSCSLIRTYNLHEKIGIVTDFNKTNWYYRQYKGKMLYKMQFHSDTSGMILGKDNDYTFFISSENGGIFCVYSKERDVLLKILMGHEYVRETNNNIGYLRKEFLLQMKNVLSDKEILFLATVIINKYKSRTARKKQLKFSKFEDN